MDNSQLSDHARLLQLHTEVMEAHRHSQVELLLQAEGDGYIVANRGQVTWPTLAERRARLGPYLHKTRFTEYSDVIPPSVTVSADGTLGWVIVQIRARGEQVVAEEGRTEPLEFEAAWIELYQKQGGAWCRVGNVSNFKP